MVGKLDVLHVACATSAIGPSMLILKRASKSRKSGEWSDDDYDVFDGDRCIGRIFWAQAAPVDRRWMWTIMVRSPQALTDRGYAETREDAMQAFKRSWERITGK